MPYFLWSNLSLESHLLRDFTGIAKGFYRIFDLMFATQVGVGPDGVIMIYPWNSPAKSSRVYKGISIPRTWEPTVQFNSKLLLPLHFPRVPYSKQLLHMWVIQIPPYAWTVTYTNLSQWSRVNRLSPWLSNSSAHQRPGSANNADSPECVYLQTQAQHTTNASHAIAPWALALAPRQEPEQPRRVHVLTSMPNHQRTRFLAVCPWFLRRSNQSTHTTRTQGSRRIGRPIAVRASWSRDSRLKAGNCLCGLENHAFWDFGNSEHCLIHQVFTLDRCLARRR